MSESDPDYFWSNSDSWELNSRSAGDGCSCCLRKKKWKMPMMMRREMGSDTPCHSDGDAAVGTPLLKIRWSLAPESSRHVPQESREEWWGVTGGPQRLHDDDFGWANGPLLHLSQYCWHNSSGPGHLRKTMILKSIGANNRLPLETSLAPHRPPYTQVRSPLFFERNSPPLHGCVSTFWSVSGAPQNWSSPMIVGIPLLNYWSVLNPRKSQPGMSRGMHMSRLMFLSLIQTHLRQPHLMTRVAGHRPHGSYRSQWSLLTGAERRISWLWYTSEDHFPLFVSCPAGFFAERLWTSYTPAISSWWSSFHPSLALWTSSSDKLEKRRRKNRSSFSTNNKRHSHPYDNYNKMSIGYSG